MKPSENLSRVSISGSIPLICVFELTRRCNLKCAHCYIGGHDSPKKELTSVKIRSVLDELALAGCLNLVFTGGEIFLRPDAVELCAAAREKGFDLRIFTNGTLIDDKIAAKLGLMGVSGVEISLYGTRPVHDRVTGSKNSFARAVNAIKILKRNKVPVTIKTPVMKTNFKDYKWLASFAKELGVNIRYDPIIAPRDDGDKSVLKHRLTARQMSELFQDPEIAGKPAVGPAEADFSCSAGRNMATIGFDGTVYPCLQLLVPAGNLLKNKFSDIWSSRNGRLDKFRKLSIKDFHTCRECSLAVYCRRCPGLALLEDGTLTGPSKTACKIAGIEKSIAHYFQ